MIRAIKRLIIFACLLIVLAFIFNDGLLYYVSRWHEKTGDAKKAMKGYTELIRKYPDSKWIQRAKKAIGRLKSSK